MVGLMRLEFEAILRCIFRSHGVTVAKERG